MPLTTVRKGESTIGAMPSGVNAARGLGFNFVQTMCVGKNGILYATNRDNENNFGMHVNKVQLGNGHRLGQSPGLRLRFRRTADLQLDRRRSGIVEMGPADG
jgi:hypothetical protein